tara:strand:- start:784 stop:1008 length:225 start_codon:yes stop_codon:yes gene_type:complete
MEKIMSEIYFKKDKSKFQVGYSDIIFKFDKNRHNLENCRERFIECDVNGNEIKKEKPKAKPKAKPKKKTKKEDK